MIIIIIIVLLLNKKGKTKKNDNSINIDNNFEQANNISNIEESMQAQDVWTDESVQVIQPMNPIPEQSINPIPEQPIRPENQTDPNVFEQELQNQNNQY